jgi:hypothetical protein
MPEPEIKDGGEKPKGKKKDFLAKNKWYIIGGLALIAILVFYFVQRSAGTTQDPTQAGMDPNSLPYGMAGVGGVGTVGPPGPAGQRGPRGRPGRRGRAGRRPRPIVHPIGRIPPPRHRRRRRREPTPVPIQPLGQRNVTVRRTQTTTAGAQLRDFNTTPVPMVRR